MTSAAVKKKTEHASAQRGRDRKKTKLTRSVYEAAPNRGFDVTAYNEETGTRLREHVRSSRSVLPDKDKIEEECSARDVVKGKWSMVKSRAYIYMTTMNHFAFILKMP